MDDLDLSYQINRIVPNGGFCGDVWETYSKTQSAASIWGSQCFDSRKALIEALRRRPTAWGVKNSYFAHASFRAPGPPYRHQTTLTLDRHVPNLLAVKTLVIDGDVKESGFNSTSECKRILCCDLAEIGIRPSFITYTSAPLDRSAPIERSGLHLTLTMTRCPPLEQWKTMAENLIAFLKHRGRSFDTGVTSDPVRIIRPVGSINNKTDEALIARLDLDSVDGPDQNPDVLGAILARHRPLARMHDSQPFDHTHVDLTEIASVADYSLAHGHYGPGRYFFLRDLFFALAQLAYERPDLHDEIRALFERIAVATGRDHARAMNWFDKACERAPGYADVKHVSIATVFHHAYKLGWRPQLSPEQKAAYEHGRAILRATFDSQLPRANIAERAAHIIERALDPVVRRKLGDAAASQLLRHGWPDVMVRAALSLAARHQVETTPAWLDRFRRRAG
jgi:hypothetical protein